MFISCCCCCCSKRLECHKALGMESGAISDAKITASSQFDVNHASRQGRLNFQETGAKSGSWAAGTNDGNQWLQVDLGNQHTSVTGVATQGRNYIVGSPYIDHSQWVTKYKLQYSSDDGVNFAYYKEKGQTVAKASSKYFKYVKLSFIFTNKWKYCSVNELQAAYHHFKLNFIQAQLLLRQG